MTQITEEETIYLGSISISRLRVTCTDECP